MGICQSIIPYPKYNKEDPQTQRPTINSSKMVCLVNGNPLFFDFDQTTQFGKGVFDEYKVVYFDFSEETKEIYADLVKKDQKAKELQDYFYKKEQDTKKAAQEEKLKQEAEKAALERKTIEDTRKRKGQYVMRFYETAKYSSSNGQDCMKKCVKLTEMNTGYATLQEALDNKWVFKSKIGDAKETINDSCICEGNSVLLERL